MNDPRADEAFRRSICTQLRSGGGLRSEADSLGERQIPSEAYWGANVSRALENFAISGRPISVYSDFIYAYACVKQAAARANAEIGVLERWKADLIDRACMEIREGSLRDQFVVDIMQGGAGTSTNMNFNEVIANRALEIAGYARGDYGRIDPNDDVNRSQSTNDTYPTALKIGLHLALDRLQAELALLATALHSKGAEFAGIVKIGRTQLQDAAPMTLGQEFQAFAVSLGEECLSFEHVMRQLCEISLGATAIGTGIAAHARYADAARRHLADITGYPLRTAPDLIEATTDVGCFMELSGALKRCAMKLSKLCNDLRLLSSGPQAGLGEITLPARQAGSSIMPGKVNPVIPEAVNQVAFVVAGGDVTLTMAAEAGQLQLNAFEPVMAHVLFENLKWLTAAVATLREHCIVGVQANVERLERHAESFVGVITALIPYIGYEPAARLAKQVLADGGDIVEAIVASGLLSREQVSSLVTVERLTGEQRKH
ncbi:MAG TPA: aspartate ammonia-lyase [Steroidobacter sp.]|uniref:aspartate ammonia-lyase n=1 Tax=Steroidobacter sp. TaxID=1978227 RepID=UPI002ED84E7B